MDHIKKFTRWMFSFSILVCVVMMMVGVLTLAPEWAMWTMLGVFTAVMIGIIIVTLRKHRSWLTNERVKSERLREKIKNR